ncbi:MAG: GTP 3',8-cyclase MoaA [Bacteroidia bacterium]|nr:GTP 3',8-cyclase MoaA [Bacteroidia bacterium]
MSEFPSITDPFGRVHDYLRISLTERCNLRCFYCMPEEGIPLRPKAQFMTRDEVLKIASVFVESGVKKIRLTGGEPLVRNDAAEIIRGLGQLPVELVITTNGVLADGFIDVFKESGIRSVNVSLDSLKPERLKQITRRDHVEKVLTNVDRLLDQGFRVKLNAVLIKGVNDDEITEFIEYTRDRAVFYRFIEFMPFDGNKWNWSKGVSYREIMERAAEKYGEKVERLEDAKNDTSRNYRVKGYKGGFAVISTVSNPFCDTCNRMRLTADGKMKNCLFSGTETDILGALRSGKEIRPLIYESVWHKKKSRGGMESMEELSDPLLHRKNRTMISIGG